MWKLSRADSAGVAIKAGRMRLYKIVKMCIKFHIKRLTINHSLFYHHNFANIKDLLEISS
jgi:hypothetical protein